MKLRDLFPHVTAKRDHPAKFSPEVLQVISMMLETYTTNNRIKHVLDPFAGTGGVLALAEGWWVPETQWILNEIEPEWALECECQMIARDVSGVVLCHDWLKMDPHPVFQWWGEVDLAITSPAYGNRMADRHQPSPEDTSKRITYRHRLGRQLHENNSGGMQWGDKYRDFHRLAWRELFDAMRPGGLFVLNVSDHIRDGDRVPVIAWHKSVLSRVGFQLVEERWVGTKRMGFGANRDARVDHESVIVWRKPE